MLLKSIQQGRLWTLGLVFSGCLLAAPPLVAADTEEANFYQALNAAIQHDPELRAAWKTRLAEQEEANRARAGLLPRVEFSAGYSYEDSESIFTDSPAFADDPRSDGKLHEHYWSLSLDQPLFNWSAVQDWRAAVQGDEAAGWRYTQSERQLILRVTETYLELLFSARQEYLYRQQLETQELQISQARRQQDLGIGDRITLLEIQSQQDLTRTDLLEARSNYADARTRLENMTGQLIDIPENWRIAEHQPQPLALESSEEDWLELSLKNFTYRETQARVRQAELTRSSRFAQHYPTVNFNLTYMDRDSDDEYRTRESWRAGIDLRLPLYNGGGTQAAFRQADAQLQAESARSDQSLAEARQQIRLAYNRATSLAQRLEALRKSESSTRSFLEAATRGMDLNLRSKIDVLDARSQLLDVQLRYAQTLQNYLQADMELHHAAGQLTPERLHYYDQLFNEAARKVEQAGQI